MPRHTAFILRVWRSTRHERVQWAARLEDLRDGRHEQFTNPDALLAHLRGLLDSEARSGPDPPEGTDTPGDRA
ncbi:MAG TPA: hypothetical protein VIJ28_18130 [Chloroflexota bacterium]